MRLRRIEEEFGDAVRIEWRSFLLRPYPDPSRTLEKFRAYTRSWQRPAADPDGGTFRVWATNEGPPSHSVPPHLVAKAAATVSDDAFQRMHMRLLHAYFAENRDITNVVTLQALWMDLQLPADAFGRMEDDALLEEVTTQHDEAVALGVTGVPAVRIAGNDAVILGAQPIEFYRRWVERALGG